ncbi:MAG: CHAT domain-containing protein [Anaerolineae bacterium]|nr:CHAT domain-containing protein [Anaerolineae bacterium]
MPSKAQLLMVIPIALFIGGIASSLHDWPRPSRWGIPFPPIVSMNSPDVADATSLPLQKTGALTMTVPAAQNPGTAQPESTLPFTLINEIDRPICRVYLSPVRQTDGFLEWLQGDLIAPGEARTFDLLPGMYTALVRDCLGAMVLYRNYLDVSTPYELRLTGIDLRAAPCQEQNYAGMMAYNKGSFPEALAQFRAALACFQNVPYRWGEGEAYNNIAAVYLAQGRLGDAMALFNQALATAKAEKNLDGESAALNGIATVYRYQWRYDEALKNLERVQAIRDQLADPRGVATALNNQGEILRLQRQFEAALQVYQQALVIQRQLNHRLAEGNTLNNMAVVYEYQGDYTRASTYFQKALKIAQEQQSPSIEIAALSGLGRTLNHEERYEAALEKFTLALTIARRAGLPASEAGILTNMALVHKAQGRSTEALANYTAAMDLLETIRATAGSEAGRAGFIGRYSELYDAAVELYFQEGHNTQAFFVSERGRARAFLDSLVTGQVQLGDSIDDRLLDQQGYAAVLSAIESGSGRPVDETTRSTAHTLEVSQVQPLLADQTTLVSYYLLEDHILAFILTRHSFETVALEVGPAAVADKINAFRAFTDLSAAHPTSAIDLYEMVIAPLKDHLNTPHLAIIPHQQLHYLPFAALTDGQHYLIDDYTLTVLPSASALPFILANTNPSALSLQPSALVVGNPTTADYETIASLAITRGSLRSLPFAEKEAKVIAKLFGVEPLIGEAATESAVREQVGKANIVHLAAHGQFNAVAPLNSLIALAPDDENDGWLTVDEVYSLNLHQADLVVLSACNTNLGDLSQGDELVGLTRALLFAGTPCVMASLWPIEDESTSMLMARFYTHLKGGWGQAEALRQAQIEVRAEHPHPYYWSGFVLSGDPGQIEPQLYCSTAQPEPTGRDNSLTEAANDNHPPTSEPFTDNQDQFSGNCLNLLIIFALGLTGMAVKRLNR